LGGLEDNEPPVPLVDRREPDCAGASSIDSNVGEPALQLAEGLKKTISIPRPGEINDDAPLWRPSR
jgi:hypothetical protein